MPVTRYRSIEEMPPPPARATPGDNLRLACELSELCFVLADGVEVAKPKVIGEVLASGRVWRSKGPHVFAPRR